jgi:glutathione S-transferase
MPKERGDMKLIGMLDSPYVRRVAISMRVMGLPFEHQGVSVFSHFDQFRAINPVVKAPSLVCDDGQVLMDSTLILDYAEAMAEPQRRLMPADLAARQQALCNLGLALAACEKSVQMIYERNLRPAELWHQPWLDRVLGQMSAAYGALEAALQRQPLMPGASQARWLGSSRGRCWRSNSIPWPTRHFRPFMRPQRPCLNFWRFHPQALVSKSEVCHVRRCCSCS